MYIYWNEILKTSFVLKPKLLIVKKLIALNQIIKTLIFSPDIFYNQLHKIVQKLLKRFEYV